MRIVIVSAYSPPDFISGGTLVPRGHARALRAQRHDVRVYAGSLDPGVEQPYESTEVSGLPIRWVPVRDGVPDE